MTDRHKGYLVALANDVREDDAEATIAALRQIKGVISVQPILASADDAIAAIRADRAWRDRLYDLLQETL